MTLKNHNALWYANRVVLWVSTKSQRGLAMVPWDCITYTLCSIDGQSLMQQQGQVTGIHTRILKQ